MSRFRQAEGNISRASRRRDRQLDRGPPEAQADLNRGRRFGRLSGQEGSGLRASVLAPADASTPCRGFLQLSGSSRGEGR